MSTSPNSGVDTDYAMKIANDSFDWYERAAKINRTGYKITETTLVVVGAAIPTSAAIAPNEVVIPAILGGMVVVLAGLRSVFHWQDNYLRFSGAREAVNAERRLYTTGANPYNDHATRDQILTSAVSRIEQDEMKGWVAVAAARPKP